MKLWKRGVIRKKAAVLLCMGVLLSVLSACGTKKSSYQRNKGLSADRVTLKLTGMTPSFKAMEKAIASFNKIYPNCSVEYEYIQDYDNSMKTRLQNNDNVDLFITNNITSTSAFLPYAMELKSQKDRLNLDSTYDGLIRNFTIPGNNGGLYALPLGGEVRGVYVNVTLLNSLGLSVPSGYAEWMDCCGKLKAAGYIPLQGNPGLFGQQLMYPYVCSLIANADDYQAVYNEVNKCRPGVSERFREPMKRLYDMVANGYYNYKSVETQYRAFMDGTDETAARSFLNIESAPDGSGQKKDDLGTAAFMPGTMSFKSYLDKMRDDYHSKIEYRFILAPVGDDGGYVYLSPAEGIAVNKNSSRAEWALEFLNYLFSKDANKAFAADRNIIPNTPDALDIISSQFKVGSGHVCQLGQVSFDYVFYNVMKEALTEVSKGNNPKYMKSDGTMYDLDHYMSNLENAFAAKRR
jgi:raffinose/stachyose/melibiose transport system substrate-binding protein